MAPKIRIEPARFADTLKIALNMRVWDHVEIYVQREHDPAQLARDAVACHISMNVFRGDDPVANLGAHEVENGRWQVHLFATDWFPSCSLFTTRYVVRKLIPAGVRDMGAKSLFCWSMAGHDNAQAWLRALGAKEVGEAPLGRAGERFLLFEWPADVLSAFKA
jgi:hypothetical protein